MLRPYQQNAVNALFQYQKDRPNESCVIVIPTGGGKTLVMAEIINRFFSANSECRGMLLSHVKELLEQSENTCNRIADQTVVSKNDIGVYSSGMKRKEVKRLTIAGIQSIHRKADLFGKLDFILIDECHLISPNAETMYQRFIQAAKIRNPNIVIAGLTATPYRLQSGIIFGPGKTFNNCCYAIGVKDLISGGYLSPLVTVGYKEHLDLKKVRVRAGEYLASDLDQILENESLVNASVAETIHKSVGRKSILVFGSSIRHAEIILDCLQKNGEQSCEMITGETATAIRDFKIRQFREGKIKWLVNVAVLTTGFDAPCTDCVVVMRPTLSKGLWYQMVGRGFRLNSGKENCLILDFGENALRHGCIDQIEVDGYGIEKPAPKVKKCPSCAFIHRINIPICPSCGYFKPREERNEVPTKLSATQTDGEIISGMKVREFQIVSTVYSIYRKNPAADPCIRESHETMQGNIIQSFHSLRHGLEYGLWKWLKSIGCRNIPDHHWHLDKTLLQSQEWLDTLPRPTSIKAHKNEKGYWSIDQYTFLASEFFVGVGSKG